MSYRDNVSALAAKLGVSNDPGLREEDLRIKSIEFTKHDDSTLVIEATDMNKGGRLLIQYQLGHRYGLNWDDITPHFLQQAKEYFAELWEENPVPGKRPLLDAIRSSKRFKVTKK